MVRRYLLLYPKIGASRTVFQPDCLVKPFVLKPSGPSVMDSVFSKLTNPPHGCVFMGNHNPTGFGVGVSPRRVSKGLFEVLPWIVTIYLHTRWYTVSHPCIPWHIYMYTYPVNTYTGNTLVLSLASHCVNINIFTHLGG